MAEQTIPNQISAEGPQQPLAPEVGVSFDKRPINVGGNTLFADANLGLAFKESGLSQDFIADALQNDPEIRQKYPTSAFVARDLDDDPRSYPFAQYSADMRKAMQTVYGGQALNVLKNTNKKAYGKFFYQHLYNGISENPILERYYRKHYPNQFKKLADRANVYEVQLATDQFNKPILANINHNRHSLFKNPSYTPQPFDRESIDIATNESELGMKTKRIVYETTMVTAGALADIVITPREKLLDFFNKYEELLGSTPQGIAGYINSITAGLARQVGVQIRPETQIQIKMFLVLKVKLL